MFLVLGMIYYFNIKNRAFILLIFTYHPVSVKPYGSSSQITLTLCYTNHGSLKSASRSLKPCRLHGCRIG